MTDLYSHGNILQQTYVLTYILTLKMLNIFKMYFLLVDPCLFEVIYFTEVNSAFIF